MMCFFCLPRSSNPLISRIMHFVVTAAALTRYEFGEALEKSNKLTCLNATKAGNGKGLLGHGFSYLTFIIIALLLLINDLSSTASVSFGYAS